MTKYNYPSIVFFSFLHLSPFLLFWTGAHLIDWIVCISLYFGRIFFIGAGYHRYFSHRAFKTSRIFQFILAFLSQTAIQTGVINWAANHRKHHRFSDQKEDVHSPIQEGFLYAHLGWMLVGAHSNAELSNVRDLTRFKELLWLNKFHYIPAVVLGSILFYFGGLSMLVVGFFISTLFLYHGTWTINSLSHLWGSQRYNTKDSSRNNWLLAIITFGEGWHNNHHHFQTSVRQGFFWWEYDITFYILKFLSFTRLIWDLKGVPVEIKYNF